MSKLAPVLVVAALTTVGLVAAPQAGAYTLGWSACVNPSGTTCDDTFTVPVADMCTPTTTTPCVVYDRSAAADDGGGCSDEYFALDQADQPVRAFRFKNSLDPPEYRVSVSSSTSGNPNEQAPDGNRRLIGPSLQSVMRENHPGQPPAEFRGCSENVVLSSDFQSTPGSYLNHEWLDSPYFVESSPGSGTGDVYGIVHNEFHGEYYDPQMNCPDENMGVEDCWLSSITLATAKFSLQPPIVNQVGALYEHPAGSPLVATIPYQYDPPSMKGQSQPNPPPGCSEADCWGRHGYIAPTNVIRATLPGQPEAYYMLAQVSARGAQKFGICALRSQNLSDPESWTAWGGYQQDWTVDLVNPYLTPPATPAAHVCTPVSSRELTGLVPRSMYWDRHVNKFILIGTITGGPLVYSLSDDLLNWSELQQLLADGPDTDSCHEESGAYATILDPSDPASDSATQGLLPGQADEPVVTPNFDHPGRNPYLIFGRPRNLIQGRGFPCDAGAPYYNADIVRVPIRLETRRATLDGGISGTDDSYDSTSTGPSGSPSSFVSGTGGDYENEGTVRHAVATNNIVDASSPRWAYGTLNLRGGALDDVDTSDPSGFSNANGFWYSSSFYLPKDADNCANDFICENRTGNVDIMRWESTGFFSGIRLKKDLLNTPRFYLVRGSGTAGTVSTYIGAPFDLPTGRTFWLEVHERLSNTDGSALSEVYVDGRLVMSSTAANRGAETSGSNPTHVTDNNPVRKVKYGFVSNTSQVGTNSVMALDSSSVTGGQLGALGAPATPTGLTALPAFSQTTVGLFANSVAGDATHPAPAGYRWYRRDDTDTEPGAQATWEFQDETATPTFLDSDLSCNTRYWYRVTTSWEPFEDAPEIDRKESVPSAQVKTTTQAC